MTQEKTEETRERIIDYWKTETPLFIITKADAWISGYINEQPSELFFWILHWKDKQAKKIFYKDIHIFKPFEGDFSRLPLPQYMLTAGAKSQQDAVAKDAVIPAKSSQKKRRKV